MVMGLYIVSRPVLYATSIQPLRAPWVWRSHFDLCEACQYGMAECVSPYFVTDTKEWKKFGCVQIRDLHKIYSANKRVCARLKCLPPWTKRRRVLGRVAMSTEALDGLAVPVGKLRPNGTHDKSDATL